MTAGRHVTAGHSDFAAQRAKGARIPRLRSGKRALDPFGCAQGKKPALQQRAYKDIQPARVPLGTGFSGVARTGVTPSA